MPLKIVYIDDEVDLCDLFLDYLSSDQILIKTYSDPQLALVEIELDPPDLVFVDYRLPHTTGEEIAKKIKDSIPKILVSGELVKQNTVLFSYVISKPYNFEEIKKIIDDYLKKTISKKST